MKDKTLKDCKTRKEEREYITDHGLTEEDWEGMEETKLEPSDNPGRVYGVPFDMAEARRLAALAKRKKIDLFDMLQGWILERMKAEEKLLEEKQQLPRKKLVKPQTRTVSTRRKAAA